MVSAVPPIDSAKSDLPSQSSAILSRSEAIKLVKEYDGQCSENYIQNFCDYVSISKDEFWSTVEKFRGPMWIRNSEKKWHNTVWDNF